LYHERHEDEAILIATMDGLTAKSEVNWSCFRSIPSKTGVGEEMAWKTKDCFWVRDMYRHCTR